MAGARHRAHRRREHDHDAALPPPSNEAARAAAVDALRPPSGRGEPLFDEVTEIAREALETPVALVSLIDNDTLRLLAHAGTDIPGMPKEFILCARSFISHEPLVIPDALADPRLATQPIVVDEPAVCFYAGVPAIVSGGFMVGTVCVVARPAPTDEQMRLVERLAHVIARTHGIPVEPDAAAAAALEAAQRRAQDEFLALVSHEMRTPLDAIVGVSEILEPKDEGKRDLVEAMRHAGAHLRPSSRT